MADIQGIGPGQPDNIRAYREEYFKGAELFQKSLIQAAESKYAPQREQFHEVMKESMEILNQTARQLRDQDLLHHNEQIAKDFEQYQKEPTKEHEQSLQKDLENAKNSLG